MRFSPFDYIRRKVAEAFVLGAADGINAVSADGDVPDEDSLRVLLDNTVKKMLPAIKDDEGVKKTKK